MACAGLASSRELQTRTAAAETSHRKKTVITPIVSIRRAILMACLAFAARFIRQKLRYSARRVCGSGQSTEYPRAVSVTLNSS